MQQPPLYGCFIWVVTKLHGLYHLTLRSMLPLVILKTGFLYISLQPTLLTRLPLSIPVKYCKLLNLLLSFHCRSRNLRPGSVRRVRKRAILKNGDCNVFQANLTGRRIRFLQDVFTTLVDSQWRWTLLVFALGFILSWLGFGLIWWLIVVTHGDLEEMHLPQHQGKRLGSIDCLLLLNYRLFFSIYSS